MHVSLFVYIIHIQDPVHHFCTHAWSNIMITHLFTRHEKAASRLSFYITDIPCSFKTYRYKTETSFITPYLKQYLSIIYTLLNDLLVNTSENQILLVARLLEGCHNNSSFTLRLLHGLNGNLMMLGKSQELLIFAPKNIYIKNFLQSTSDLR